MVQRECYEIWEGCRKKNKTKIHFLKVVVGEKSVVMFRPPSSALQLIDFRGAPAVPGKGWSQGQRQVEKLENQ